MKQRILTGIAAVGLAATAMTVQVAGTRSTFVPDWTFKGSSLAAFRTIGHAEWKAVNGEIVGTPTAPDGGWLFLDRTLQDLQFAANVRCTPECVAGVMVRAGQTADGTKGVFVPFGNTDTAAFALTLDRDGREVTRERLDNAGGMVRVAAARGAGGRAGAAGGPGAAGGFGRAAGAGTPRGRQGQMLPCRPRCAIT